MSHLHKKYVACSPESLVAGRKTKPNSTLAEMFLRKYFAAWWADWTSRMSGFASVLLTFWATFFPPTPNQARWALIASAIICFIAGSYFIWAREYKALLEERNKNQLPDLKATLRQIAVGNWEQGGVIRGSVITLFLLLQNRGAPSAVGNWALHVDFPSGKSVEGAPIVFDGVLPWGRSDRSIEGLRSVDRLDTKLAETPIPQGGQAAGFLLYAFDGIASGTVFQPGVKARLEYSDITERPSHKLEHDFGEGTLMVDGEAIYLPGMTVKRHPSEK